MQKTILIFERGILGWDALWGGWHDWPNRACVWVHENTDFRAQSLLYFTGPFLAGVTRHRRALSLSKFIRAYSVKDWRIIIAAHSEGTATAIEALRLAGWPKVHALHLLSGAADSNFERNGLNRALRIKSIGRVYCYGEEHDTAMKIENTWLGKLLFLVGFKDEPLGLIKPSDKNGFRLARNVSLANCSKVAELFANGGHSDWFLPGNFEKTLRHFLV